MPEANTKRYQPRDANARPSQPEAVAKGQSVDVPMGTDGKPVRPRRRRKSTKRIGPVRRGLAKLLGIDLQEIESRSKSATRRRRSAAMRGENLPGADGGRIPQTNQSENSAEAEAASAVDQAYAAIEEAEQTLSPPMRKNRKAAQNVQWAQHPTPTVADVLQEFHWD